MRIPQSFYDEWKPKVGDDVLITSGDLSGDICKITRLYEDDQCVLRTAKTDIHICKCLPINVDIPWEADKDSVCPVPSDIQIEVKAEGNDWNSSDTSWRKRPGSYTITSFRILPPEQEDDMTNTQEDETHALRERIKELEKSLVGFEYLQNENKSLKSELAKHKPDPFVSTFDQKQLVYMVCVNGKVIDFYFDNHGCDHQSLYEQGRVFTTHEKAEEFARVEQTRVKIEMLAKKHKVSWIKLILEYQDIINGTVMHDMPFMRYVDDVNLIGEEAIREFLEWKR